MTSLIDVIFLLLLFFMLTSTFSEFAEVELSAGAAAIGVTPAQAPPVFLRLGEIELSVNGDATALAALTTRLESVEDAPVLISLQTGVTAQRLTDLMVVLRTVPGLRVTVLGEA